MRQWQFDNLAAALPALLACVLIAGCGGGGNSHAVITPATVMAGTPAASSPDTPSARLADLSHGASWDYVTYPGETSIPADARPGPPPVSTGHKYALLTPVNSQAAIQSGFGALDTDRPGALLRLEKIVPASSATAYSAAVSPTYVYQGTFRQDPQTGDLLLLRLPTGELLDRPARVLPGVWAAGETIHSAFTVGGALREDYTLTVDAAEVIPTVLGSKPVWRTTITTDYAAAHLAHRMVTRQWIEPASGTYLQATCRDTAAILSDFSVVQIKDDEIISAYTLSQAP